MDNAWLGHSLQSSIEALLALEAVWGTSDWDVARRNSLITNLSSWLIIGDWDVTHLSRSTHLSLQDSSTNCIVPFQILRGVVQGTLSTDDIPYPFPPPVDEYSSSWLCNSIIEPRGYSWRKFICTFSTGIPKALQGNWCPIYALLSMKLFSKSSVTHTILHPIRKYQRRTDY